MVPQLVRKSAAGTQRQNKRRENFCIVTHWKSALCVFCQYRSAVLRTQNPRVRFVVATALWVVSMDVDLEGYGPQGRGYTNLDMQKQIPPKGATRLAINKTQAAASTS